MCFKEAPKKLLKHTFPSQQTTESQLTNTGVSLRRLPFPFRAMLAICSDLDGTPDGHVYFSMMKYLNTRENTKFGPGLGIEVGNTIYFDVAPPQFCYWNTSDVGRAMARQLIRSGHIDCLHSFGTRATTRRDAARALEELEKHNCRLKVWVDHARVQTNLGSDVTAGSGDIVGSPAYHADLTTSYGVGYIWRGRVTSIIGQDVRRSLCGIADKNHPLISCKTVFKECIKGLPFIPRFALHQTNKLTIETQLRSGHRVHEFMRSNPHWGGVSAGATADGIPDVLTAKTLNRLLLREGSCILYTHLGRAIDPHHPFSPRVKAALSLLSEYSSERKILVTTTRRLLDYNLAIQNLQISISPSEQISRIDISTRGEEVPLNGVTMYVRDSSHVTVYVDGDEVHNLQRNPPDHTGQASISLPWQKLEFPQLEQSPYV